MTSQEILEKFTALIQQNVWWSRFVNSQFMKMLAIMLSQIIYAAQTAAEKALTEGFISTATKRSSILAGAEDRGYVARQIMPSYGTSSVTNKTQIQQSLPIYADLISDEQKRYMLVEPLVLKPGETRHGVPTKQLEREQLIFDVENETEFLSFTLTKAMTKRCVSIEVSVTDNGVARRWEENPQFRLSNKNSLHYVKFYRPTEQIGIRFGDGSIGKMPAGGEQVILDVWLSDGDITLVQGQTLTPYAGSSDLSGKIEVKTETPITNGAGYETTEETRNRAQYFTAYDGQVVWGADYKFYLRTQIPNISWINAWGEKEQEKSTGVHSLKNINTVFFCGHKKGLTQEQMESVVLSTFQDIPNELNKNFVYVKTNERPFTINVTGVVKKNEVIVDAEKKIRDELEARAGRDSSNFERDESGEFARVSHNEVWAIIQSTGLLSKFKLEILNMSEAAALNDFIYLDVKKSKFELKY
ncbi:TPA: baseplate protein [Serratia marcescens]|uniref:baseplate protein n=1 Tax=Serratia marcescens TaxID=615 RepID=UPI0036FCA2A3